MITIQDTGGGQLKARERITKLTGITEMYFVPVCAFGITYNVYADKNTMVNQIAEVVYDKDYWNKPR